MTSVGNYFNDITENQLTEFPVVYWVKGKKFCVTTQRGCIAQCPFPLNTPLPFISTSPKIPTILSPLTFFLYTPVPPFAYGPASLLIDRKAWSPLGHQLLGHCRQRHKLRPGWKFLNTNFTWKRSLILATKLVFRQICYTKFRAYLFISTRHSSFWYVGRIELNSAIFPHTLSHWMRKW